MANAIRTVDDFLFNHFSNFVGKETIDPSIMRDLLLSVMGYPTGALTNPHTPTVGAVTQNFTTPPGPISTSQVQPFGVTLRNPNSNVLDWTFGYATPGATIRTRADLDAQSWYRDLFDVTTQPFNYLSQHSVYPAYLSDGMTRDPRDLHPIWGDRIDLIGRTKMTTDSDTATFKTGFIRPPTLFLPGMYAECCCKWPTDPNAWPVFWMFSGAQDVGTDQAYFAADGTALEIDCFDGYVLDGQSRNGIQISCGTPLYAADSVYGNPDDLYISRRPPYTARYDGSGGGSIGQYVTTSASDPTNGYHYYALDWRDPNTLLWIFDGVVIKKRRIRYPAVYNSSTMTGAPPPSNLVGRILPMFIQIDMQYGVVFNTANTAALNTAVTGGATFRAAYGVKSVRVWSSTSTADAPWTTPPVLFLPAQPRSGAAGTQPPIFGDLPNITTATYILNVDAGSSNPTADLVGHNDVQLVGDAVTSTTTINGRTTIACTAGGLSIVGPAVAVAQGTNQFVIWVIIQGNWTNSHSQVVASFSCATPQSNEYYDKMTLGTSGVTLANNVAGAQTGGDYGFGTYLNTTAGGWSSSLQWFSTNNIPLLVGMTKIIGSDGTINLGASYSQIHTTPYTTGGVPVAQAQNFTELTIGFARNYYGSIVNNPNGGNFICQVVQVQVPGGTTLSAGDRASIEVYLQTKWGLSGAGIHALSEVAAN